jgi:hypothetical protein
MPNSPAPSRSCSRRTYSVIIFNDNTAAALREHMSLPDPRREARRHGGARDRVLLSEEGFEAVVGRPPQPRHRATEEHGPVGP